jgi:hypothetical protein
MRHIQQRFRALLRTTLALVALAACEGPPTMTVESTDHPAADPPHEGPARSRGCGPADRKPVTVLTGDAVRVRFDKPIEGKSTNQYWIQLVPAGTPESDTSGRLLVPRGVTSAEVRASSPGNYEVRLHGSYPEKEHALIARVPVTIAGYPVKTGNGAVLPP